MSAAGTVKSPRAAPVNRLNDLVAKEWIPETVSVWVQRGLGNGHEHAQIEKQHPAPFSFQDVARVIRFFTAEQLGDVIRRGDQFYMADAPGQAAEAEEEQPRRRRIAGARAPRSSREVTPDTIGRAGLAEENNEFEPPPDLDPEAAAAAIRARARRLRRHNALVRRLAARLSEADEGQLFEDPFDILMLYRTRAILVEVKSLDGTPEDERDRVRDALAQLLYYEGFVTRPVAGETRVRKVACFESKISDAHIAWLNAHGIVVIWEEAEGEFAGDDLASEFLRRYLDELE